jgi:hypothetical protein
MDDDDRAAARFRFDDPVNVLAALDTLGIEHLEVSAERTIIIYLRTIFNCEVFDGQLHNARTVMIEVFDRSPATETESVTLCEQLGTDIATTATSTSKSDCEWDWEAL